MRSARDFTINALLQDPETGEVLDFVGGRADLEARLIRAIGNAGVPVRRGSPADASGGALGCLAWALRSSRRPCTPSGEWLGRSARVSAERIARRVDPHPDRRRRAARPGIARRIGSATGTVAGGLAPMKGVEQPKEFHPEGDVWTHTLMMLGMLRQSVSHAGAGRAPARRRQAADLPRAGTDPLRRARGA